MTRKLLLLGTLLFIIAIVTVNIGCSTGLSKSDASDAIWSYISNNRSDARSHNFPDPYPGLVNIEIVKIGKMTEGMYPVKVNLLYSNKPSKQTEFLVIKDSYGDWQVILGGY
jgi:hypothetical protein